MKAVCHATRHPPSAGAFRHEKKKNVPLSDARKAGHKQSRAFLKPLDDGKCERREQKENEAGARTGNHGERPEWRRWAVVEGDERCKMRVGTRMNMRKRSKMRKSNASIVRVVLARKWQQ